MELFKPTHRGFTIVELLVVIAIIGMLVALIVPVAGLLGAQARHVNERNAARQMTTAWTNYTFDNNGELLPGYRSGLPAFSPSGEAIVSATIGVAANRYPWRLAPYLANNFDVLYVNEQNDVLDGFRRLDDSDYLYVSSTYPSLGLNTTWIGGDEVDGCFNPALRELFGQFFSNRLSSIRNPARLVVFCSARGLDGADGTTGDIVEGYFKVASPNFSHRRWSDVYDPLDPASAGNVSARWDGDSIVSRVDGAVDSVPLLELEDMRQWADRADTPDWALTPRLP